MLLLLQLVWKQEKKYLEKKEGLLTAALAFSFQMREKIPAEEKDVALQYVVTDEWIMGEKI